MTDRFHARTGIRNFTQHRYKENSIEGAGFKGKHRGRGLSETDIAKASPADAPARPGQHLMLEVDEIEMTTGDTARHTLTEKARSGAEFKHTRSFSELKAGDQLAWGKDHASEGQQQQEGELMRVRPALGQSSPDATPVVSGHVIFLR